MRGVDGSFTELTVERARKLKSLGIEVWAQCLWTAAVQPQTRVTNLRAAEQGGLLTMGYISLDQTNTGGWHVAQGRAGVPDDLWHNLLLVPIDIELDGIPNPAIREAVDRIAQIGTTSLNRRRAIYTNWNSWVNKQGNPNTFTDCLLWNALWDCPDLEAQTLTADLRWVPVGSLQPGDELLAPQEGGPRRKWMRSTVLSCAPVRRPCWRITLDDGNTLIASAGHGWLTKAGRTLGHEQIGNWVRTDRLYSGDSKKSRLLRVAEPWSPLNSRAVGYIAGFLDGEGSLQWRQRSLHITFSQAEGVALQHFLGALGDTGYTTGGSSHWPTVHPGHQAIYQGHVQGGLWEKLRLLGTIRPARLLERWDHALNNGFNGALWNPRTPQVVAKEYIGERWVMGLTTTSGTLLVDGYVSHNSDPDIDFYRLPFGGWTRKELVGEQYSGGTQFGGVFVDLDWFNRDLLIPPPPAKNPLLAELGMRRALMLAAGHLMEGEPASLQKAVNIMAYLGYRFGD